MRIVALCALSALLAPSLAFAGPKFSASSFKDTEKETFDAAKMFDGLLHTSWAEDAPGLGTGQWVEVDLGEDIGALLVPEERPEPGTWDTIQFRFGLSAERNVAGAFPDRPEALMEWPSTMGQGYHCMKLEGRYLDAGDVRSYALHMGPLDGVDCSVPVQLEGPFTVDEGGRIELIMDLLAWMDAPNEIDVSDPAISGGVMGSAEVQRELVENGADVWSAR